LEPFSDRRLTIPFCILTNGGGVPEHEKAEDMNKRLGFDQNPEVKAKLGEEHMFLCHSPMSDPELVLEFRDKFVLVSGFYEELLVAQHYGYEKAIHAEELAVVFPDQVPNDLLV